MATAPAFDRERLRRGAQALAAQGVFVGTSSWKYPGWLGQIYTDDRYVYRGKFSEARFERLCLAEYAEVFKTVSVDAAYYQFPTGKSLGALAAQVPVDFQFGLKVTDEITLRRFPNLPRFGRRAGADNPNFLNAELFTRAFLGACEPFRRNLGVLMFEFARFHGSDFTRGREFVAALDDFLGRIPRGWPYAVEIRNASLLQPEYFAMLARHGVAHVFNSWEAMPPPAEQLALAGSFTAPELLVARFLLKPGRKYEEAVAKFSPYRDVQEPNADGRAAGAKFLSAARRRGRGRAFLFVNNRYEGNSPGTLAAILD
ncbi:MAG: DUF72 domain-containing protein, partial [Verrucomicrobia bacterium]|nr:DUF72 domain-containing protein [Verrucomicrobiota bacterium]